LEKIWFPYFEKCFRPLVNAGITVIWHCDGNITPMVPYLLECGIEGFQGFQYEDGINYAEICKMKPKSGKDLFIIAGVSVTRTLPFGTSKDVKKEIDFLVEYGPKTGLTLGLSSSMTPGVPWVNVKTLIEGLNYYRIHGR
jgi:uroporphyrinogen decarboxylase